MRPETPRLRINSEDIDIDSIDGPPIIETTTTQNTHSDNLNSNSNSDLQSSSSSNNNNNNRSIIINEDIILSSLKDVEFESTDISSI